jgi:hypothetical protein
MSGKIISVQPGVAVVREINPVLRYAFGAAIILTAAMSLNYTLAYLTPVLAMGFLAPGVKAPTLKSSLFFLLMILFSSFSGFIFSRFFLDYPLVFIPLLILIIFHIYYSARLQQMKVWLIISLLVIPMVSMQSAQIGKSVAVNLFLNALLAMVLVGLVYFIFPESISETAKTKKTAANPPSERQRFVAAGKQIVVITPLLISFFVFNWTGALLVLIFVSILSMNPAAANKKLGLALIAANLGGGLAAIAAFNLLTVVPNLGFMALITLLTGLLFGVGLFTHKPAAALFGTAFSTFLLILGNVTSFIGEAGEMVWSRVFQLGIVVVYIVVAFYLVNHFIPSDNIKNKE